LSPDPLLADQRRGIIRIDKSRSLKEARELDPEFAQNLGNREVVLWSMLLRGAIRVKDVGETWLGIKNDHDGNANLQVFMNLLENIPPAVVR
jgi:hypothetical protein